MRRHGFKRIARTGIGSNHWCRCCYFCDRANGVRRDVWLYPWRAGRHAQEENELLMEWRRDDAT